MKKVLLPVLFCAISSLSIAQQYTTYNVTTTSSSFDPDTLMAEVGDTIAFTITTGHDVTQVSDSVYWANGVDPLPGGFVAGVGNDSLVITTTDTLYFVSSPDRGYKLIVFVSDMSTSLPVSSAVSNGIRVYPNPAQSNVAVQFPQAMHVESVSLVNSHGSEVLNQSVQSSISSHNLNVGNLEKGIYQVVITGSDKRYVSKIVVQ